MRNPPATVFVVLLAPLFAVLLTGAAPPAGSQPAPGKVHSRGDVRSRADVPSRDAAPPSKAKINTLRTPRLILRTDLDPAAAKQHADALEKTLELVADYFGRKPTGTIECRIVADLRNWPDSLLPAVAREKVAKGVGITITDTLKIDGRHVSAKAVVYAAADLRVLKHELVHAYCGQNWGATGPRWYAEGMAEIGDAWRPSTAIECRPAIANYLHSTPATSALRVASDRGAMGDDWRVYARRWALCQMLLHNPNYAARFHRLGLSYLSENAAPGFEETFASALGELEFEYRFFLAHCGTGYRVDLCSWDWPAPFAKLGSGALRDVPIAAARGWQPSGILVTSGAQYRYTTSGRWKVDSAAADVTAQGQWDGRGRLLGIILTGFELSASVEFDRHGTLVAPATGKLYLRCRDAWTALADNSGEITVRIRSREGSPERSLVRSLQEYATKPN